MGTVTPGRYQLQPLIRLQNAVYSTEFSQTCIFRWVNPLTLWLPEGVGREEPEMGISALSRLEMMAF